MDRLTGSGNELGRRILNLLPSTDEADALSDWLVAAIVKLAAYEDAEEQSCDACQYKVNSEAWLYYTYPCNECKRRTKDHFTKAAMREGRHETD